MSHFTSAQHALHHALAHSTATRKSESGKRYPSTWLDKPFRNHLECKSWKYAIKRIGNDLCIRLIPYKHNAIQMNLIYTSLTEDLSEDRLEQFPADYELQKTFVTWIA